MSTVTNERIRELRDTEVAYLDASTFNLRGEDVTDADKQALTAYLTDPPRFAEPIIEPDTVLCLNCGAALTGLLGAFAWAVVHGEGTCSRCAWPARLYHYVEFPNLGAQRVNALLQYHPDMVLLDEEEDADA